MYVSSFVCTTCCLPTEPWVSGRLTRVIKTDEDDENQPFCLKKKWLPFYFLPAVSVLIGRRRFLISCVNEAVLPPSLGTWSDVWFVFVLFCFAWALPVCLFVFCSRFIHWSDRLQYSEEEEVPSCFLWCFSGTLYLSVFNKEQTFDFIFQLFTLRRFIHRLWCVKSKIPTDRKSVSLGM